MLKQIIKIYFLFILIIVHSYSVNVFNISNIDEIDKNFLDKVEVDAHCFSLCQPKKEATKCYSNNYCDCNKFPHTKLTGLNMLGKVLKRPKLNCKTYKTANIVWDTTTTVAETLYFIEMKNKKTNQTLLTNLTNCDRISLSRLNEATKYKIRLWEIFQNNISFSEWLNIHTLYRTFQPLPVSELLLSKLVLNQNNAYNAVIKWTPAEDMPCYYDLVWFGGDAMGDYKQIEITPLVSYNTTLRGLEFSQNYSVSIMAKSSNGFYESPKTWLHFTTPSCLDSLANLTQCAPSTPENLTIVESPVDEMHYTITNPLFNIFVTWNRPRFQPDYYILRLINWMGTMQNISTEHKNVSGSASSAHFERVALGIHYQIVLTAWSTGGPSAPAVADRHMTLNLSTNTIHRQKWLLHQIFLMLLLPVVIIALAIGLIVLAVWYRSKRARNEQRCKYFNELEQKTQEAPEHLSMILITDDIVDEWELDYKKIVPQTVLGEGAFGVVRRAFLMSDSGDSKREVAIKMLKNSPTLDEIRQFTQEIEIMKSVKQYPYIVSMIGCITRGRPEGPILVVEYCSRGDLQSYLRRAWDKLSNVQKRIAYIDECYHRSPNYFANKTYDFHDEEISEEFLIQPKHLVSIARQIALGMEHLAKMRVVHRDLAARNILVCEDHSVKVSDFGLSRDVYQDNVYCKSGGGKLPVKWMALESLTHQRYTTQSDVWSFGILLWEIVTLGGTPYVGVHCSDLLGLLKSGYRLDCPTSCSEEFYAIMQSCWKASPKDRPTFTDLCKSLEILLENVSEYLRIELGSDFYLINNDRPLCHIVNLTGKYLKPAKK